MVMDDSKVPCSISAFAVQEVYKIPPTSLDQTQATLSPCAEGGWLDSDLRFSSLM